MKKEQDYALRLLIKMLEIYSPSGEEDALAEFLLGEMGALGLHSWIDEVGNVFGEIGSGKPTILLCGHLDTILGMLPVHTDDNKIYGRGAVDAKSSLASMIVALSSFVKNIPLGKIIVLGVVDEEGSGKGIKHLIQNRPEIDYAIFGEPSGIDKITIAYKGSLHLKFILNTKTGHSAAPWLFENAIDKAYDLWCIIRDYHVAEEKLESRFYSLSSCITRIDGGDLSSTVPSRCMFWVDVRIPPQLTPEQIFKDVENIIKQYRLNNPKVSIDVNIEDMNLAYEADKNSILVKSLSWAIRKVRSKQAILLRKTGTGDMNLLGNALRIPVVTYGPGDSNLDHTSNEHIDIQEYIDSITVLQEVLIRLLFLHPHG